MYKFIWTPLETKSLQLLPQEVIDEIFFYQSFYYTRFDEVKRRKVPYPIKKTVNWCFFNFSDLTFPSGFLSKVVASLGEENCEIEWSSSLPKNYLPYLKTRFSQFLSKEKIVLRYFQEEPVELIKEYGCGVIKLGTGGGKTLLYGNLIAELGVKTLVVTIDLESRNQTYEEFSKFFGTDLVTTIDEESWEHPINIANIQNLWAKYKRNNLAFMEYLTTIDLLIINECHHVNETKIKNWTDAGNTWYGIIQKISAAYRVGATGTPGPLDSLRMALLTASVGEIIYEKDTSELIDEGFASPIEAHIYDIPIENNEHIAYVKAYETMITDKNFHDTIVRLALQYSKGNKKVLIFCDWVQKQALLLHRDLNANGYLSEIVYSGIPMIERKKIVKDFKDGKFPILIGTVFSEDFNLPALDVGIIIGKKKNEIALKQRIGRVARLFEGKDKGVIVIPFAKDKRVKEYKDKNGNIKTKIVDGILATHSNRAIEILRAEGHTVIFKKLDDLNVDS